MITLSSAAELIAALRDARDVSITAYTMPAGRVLDQLVSDAQRGAHVKVRLEGYIWNDDGSVSEANARAVARLRTAGADVQYVHASKDASDSMLHYKAALVDGILFLDDRNFPSAGNDTIVRDDFVRDVRIVRDAMDGRHDASTPFFAVTKRGALASEARLLGEARSGSDAIVESESFGGYNRAYDAIDRAAREGVHVRVLVNERCLQGNASERRAIEQLTTDGVAVRVCDANEKFAIVDNSRGWLGSANATAAFDRPDETDWGVRTDAPAVVAHLRQAFEKRWSTARAVPA